MVTEARGRFDEAAGCGVGGEAPEVFGSGVGVGGGGCGGVGVGVLGGCDF